MNVLKNDPLISVLITAYNREKYIAEAIESVLESNYVHFEIIVVDDCSTDNTFDIAKDFEKKDQRIRVYKNPENLGQFANRNKAAAYAKGEYLKYVDSDDVIYKNTLEIMLAGMETFPEAGLGFCVSEESNGTKLQLIDSKLAYRKHFYEGGLLFVGPSGLIIKRTAFERVKGFEEYGMPSDNHLSLKIAGLYPVISFPQNLFLWRLHEDQVFTHNLNNHYNIINNYQYTKDIIENYSPLQLQDNIEMLKNQKKIFLSHLFRITVKKKSPIIAIKLFYLFLKGKRLYKK